MSAVQRPQGHDEIVVAVVRAATVLFAERGPAAVSLREVAREAGVTLSLIHRHIGNKEALLAAVLAHDLATGAAPGGDFQGIDLATYLRALFHVGDATTRTRLQARIILDGYDLPALQQRYPGIEFAVSLLREQLPDEEARVRAALLTTFFAGWELLGSTYLRVTGAADVDPQRFARFVAPLLDAMASAAPASPHDEPDRTK